MTDNPRYRVWMQTHDEQGLNEPTAGPWLSRAAATKVRAAMFVQPAVVRTWIEKEGIAAKFVDETPFIVGAPPEPEPEPVSVVDLANAANDLVNASPGVVFRSNHVDVTHAPAAKKKRRKPKRHIRTKPRKKAAR